MSLHPAGSEPAGLALSVCGIQMEMPCVAMTMAGDAASAGFTYSLPPGGFALVLMTHPVRLDRVARSYTSIITR